MVADREGPEVQIRIDDLRGEAIVAFLREHLDEMIAITPPGSVHALDLDGLRDPSITFWSMWDGDDLVGCGALREMDPSTGEIKSMRTSRAHRGRGHASAMLRHLLDEARARGYTRVCLETGSFPAFEPARSLYAGHGFELRGPFGDYVEDPNSVFMEKRL